MKIIEQKIESLLFFKNEPLSFLWLSKVLKTPQEVIKEIVLGMERHYENRGISLITTSDSVALMTGEAGAELIAEIKGTKEERELSKQALETLAIIVYKEKSTKPEIDYIRGVNSVFILRNLLIRGLISKKANPVDKRSPYYIPTHDLFSFLGIMSAKDLPQFDAVSEKINELDEKFKTETEHEQKEEIKVEIIQDSISEPEDIEND